MGFGTVPLSGSGWRTLNYKPEQDTMTTRRSAVVQITNSPDLADQRAAKMAEAVRPAEWAAVACP